MYNNLSAIGDCLDRYSLGVLLEPAMLAMQSLKKLLGFKSIDKPSWWHKKSRKFMFTCPELPFFLLFFCRAELPTVLWTLSGAAVVVVSVAFFGRLIVWLFLGEGRKFHIVCCVYARGDPWVPDVSRSLPGEAGRVCLPRPVSTFDTVSVLYVVAVQGSSDWGWCHY